MLTTNLIYQNSDNITTLVEKDNLKSKYPHVIEYFEYF